jgi:hypothetical protein
MGPTAVSGIVATSSILFLLTHNIYLPIITVQELLSGSFFQEKARPSVRECDVRGPPNVLSGKRQVKAESFILDLGNQNEICEKLVCFFKGDASSKRALQFFLCTGYPFKLFYLLDGLILEKTRHSRFERRDSRE